MASMEKMDLCSFIESMILISQEPLAVEKMYEALNSADISVSTRDIKDALEILEQQWQRDDKALGRGIILKKVSGGYLFATHHNSAQVIKKLTMEKPISISKAQMEVLAIVAYRQPLTRIDIDDIRGVDSSFAIKKLLQYKLLKILGKSEGLGRALLYGTTKYFLEFFSLNSLSDLPTLGQYESLGEKDEEIASSNVSMKDLFLSDDKKEMFSKKTNKMSEEALRSLDEALLKLDSVKSRIDISEKIE